MRDFRLVATKTSVKSREKRDPHHNKHACAKTTADLICFYSEQLSMAVRLLLIRKEELFMSLMEKIDKQISQLIERNLSV